MVAAKGLLSVALCPDEGQSLLYRECCSSTSLSMISIDRWD